MIPKLEEYKKRHHITSEAMIKPGLEAIQAALHKLGHPEKNLKIIHVSGTNGKGSTIHFMESILREHGYMTGAFTSPAVHDLHDQIRLNDENASEQMINEAFRTIKQAGLDGKLTDFELLTVVAFLVFEKTAPDYVLLETGMGGLLDSTNIADPIVSVITSIALDHTGFLGTTIEEITAHKAGIIKKGKPVVIGRMRPESLAMIKKIASEQDAELKGYGEDFTIEDNGREVFRGTETFLLSERKMKGPHQRINAAVAIEALAAANIELREDKLNKALQQAQLAHRFEEIYPDVFLDGAHNPAAAKALRQTIEETFPGEKVDFIIGMLKRKDLKGTLDELQPVAKSFTFLTFNHPEAATGEELMDNCRFINKKMTNISDSSIMLSKDEGARIIVSGSLYLLTTITIIMEE